MGGPRVPQPVCGARLGRRTRKGLADPLGEMSRHGDLDQVSWTGRSRYRGRDRHGLDRRVAPTTLARVGAFRGPDGELWEPVVSAQPGSCRESGLSVRLEGAPGWDEARLGNLMAYLQSFGGPKPFLTLPLAPIRLFTHKELYTAFLSSIELPSPLFLLVLLLPLTRPHRNPGHPRPCPLPATCSVGVRIPADTISPPAVSALGDPFRLPDGQTPRVAPIAGLLGVVPAGILGCILSATTLYKGLSLYRTNPLASSVGAEFRAAFLRRNVTIYAAQAFILQNLPQNAYLLTLWDGASLYCDQRWEADAEQSKWTQIVAQEVTVEGLAGHLKTLGIDYLVGNLDSINFFLAHDPDGRHTRAINFCLVRSGPSAHGRFSRIPRPSSSGSRAITGASAAHPRPAAPSKATASGQTHVRPTT